MSDYHDACNIYIDYFLKAGKKNFQSKLETYDQYADRTRKQYLMKCDDYLSSLKNGYLKITEKLKSQIK